MNSCLMPLLRKNGKLMPYLKERIRKERRKEGRKENRIELEMMWGVHPGNEDLDARPKVDLQ